MESQMDEKSVADLLKKTSTPVLLLIGLIGNMITITILSQKSMKKHESFRYIILLSMIDTCVLYAGCLQIMLDSYLKIDIRTVNTVTCKLFSFFLYFFTHFSSIYLVVINVHQMIDIKTNTNSKKSPCKVFFLVGLVIFAINSHFLIYNKIIEIDLNSAKNQLDSAMNETVGVVNHIKSIRICFCYENTKYFHFLMNYFSW